MAAPIGNANAAKENRLWGDTIRRTIAQDDGKRLRAIAEKLLDAAAAGESWAVKEMGDRLDGKPVQAVTNDGDTPFVVQVLRLADDSTP